MKHRFRASFTVTFCVSLLLIYSRQGALAQSTENIPSWSIQLEDPVVARGKTCQVVDFHDCHNYELGKLRVLGTKPIAFLSSQFEKWRPDADSFPESGLGKKMGGGDRWVNPKSPEIRAIIKKRIVTAKSRGFYGIIFDNVQFTGKQTGFDSSEATVKEFIHFLIQSTHQAGLAYGLKNAENYIDKVSGVDFYVVENGIADDTIGTYAKAGKPVFNYETSRTKKSAGDFPNVYTILKNNGEMGAAEEILSTNAAAALALREAPQKIVSWSIQYEDRIIVRNKDYHVVDLFEVSDADLAKLRAQGTKTIAYFSSQFEDWRSDIHGFPKKDIGKNLDNWDGERWINPRSEPIRQIMRRRMDIAKARGFHGIDVDNVDFYHFETGFDNSKELALEYIRFFISEAKKRGLKFSLKNATDLAYLLRNEVDFYQNEEGIEYKELYKYMGVGKPVFNIEYQKPDKNAWFPGIYSIYKSDYEMDGREIIVYPTAN